MKKFFDEFRMNLKFYRENNGWSQAQLAIQADSSIGMIGNIEAGRNYPSLMNVFNIAKAFKIHPADLFLREASKFKEKENFPELFQTAVMLKNLPEVPRAAIRQMIEEMYRNSGSSKI